MKYFCIYLDMLYLIIWSISCYIIEPMPKWSGVKKNPIYPV